MFGNRDQEIVELLEQILSQEVSNWNELHLLNESMNNLVLTTEAILAILERKAQSATVIVSANPKMVV
jgi:hypothetical protein